VQSQRPDPQPHLTKEQREIWRRIVNALPADWFRDETLDLLAEYCEQVTLSRKISQFIDELTPADGAEDLRKLQMMKDKSSRVLMSLATKMRLSQQSTYHSEKVKTTADVPDAPWQMKAG
jgi:phage terminase small subunit